MQARRLLLACALVASLIVLVHADTYLHHFRGSNNRLNEYGQERNNGARLFDSQNNNRGGYNAGSIQRPYYLEGSIVPIEWTQQHMCGDPNGNFCEMIMQYTCGDKLTRDGTTTNTIPTNPQQCTDTGGDCDSMPQYGRHESLASYQSCRYRSRNKGLFLSNQNMQGSSARFTRQNNDGGRSGLECPEERDYYPYWHPTIWRDIAIITNNVKRCDAFIAESQNTKARYYCQWDPTYPATQTAIAQDREAWVPITQAECESTTPKGFGTLYGGKWTRVEAWNIDPPRCVVNSYTRDNHLGNAMPSDPNAHTDGSPNYFNWTIPSVDIDSHCVFRLRYNISTGEFPYQGYASDTSIQSGIDYTYNMIPLVKNAPDNNARYPSEFPIWSQYNMNRSEVAGSFTARVQNDNPNDNGDGRLGGIRRAQPVSRDYTLRNNPQVDIFGSLLAHNSSSDATYNGQPMIRTRLAINTAQYGRTFQDRSHVFEIRKRPASLEGVKIYSLSVRGKKGNIVQVYPGVEYDFVPDRLHINQGDMIHIQWTGSVPSDGEGSGNNGDRSNIIMLRPRNYIETGQPANTGTSYGHWGNNYPSLINQTDTDPAFLGFDFYRLRALALFGLNSSHFDLGPVQVTQAGEYRYVCTRNNAFSNRSQKGLIVVHPNGNWSSLPDDQRLKYYPPPVSLTGETSSPSGKGRLITTWFDGTMVVPGGVMVDDVHDDWYVVNPPVMNLGVRDDMGTGQGVKLELSRPMEGNFFYKGKMMWKLNKDDEPVEILPTSGLYSAKNTYMVSNGGYYQSTAVPNSAIIAGVTLGFVGLIAIITFLYYRVRVQPLGGWKAWYAKTRGTQPPASGESQSDAQMAVVSPPAQTVQANQV